MIIILSIRWKMRFIRELKRVKDLMTLNRTIWLHNLINSQTPKLYKMRLKIWISDQMLIRSYKTHMSNFNKRWTILEESIKTTSIDFPTLTQLSKKKRYLNSFLKMLRT